MAKQRTSRNDRVNIYSVAAAARVSTATVSRTLNGVESVAENLKQRVWKAVEQQNYIPNYHAKSLRLRGKLLGLILSESVQCCFPQLIQTFEDAAFLRGYDLVIGTASAACRGTENLVRHMIECGVVGVIVLTDNLEDHLTEYLLGHHVRLLHLSAKRIALHIGAKGFDLHQAAHQAVQHLAVLGHRDIAFVTGCDEDILLRMTPFAFSDAMCRIGIDVQPGRIINDAGVNHDDLTTLQDALAKPDVPTAMICSSDLLAFKALRAAIASRLNVPDDLSIIGFGDIYPAHCTIPPLTTIQISQSDLAAYAIDALCLHGNSNKREQMRRRGILLSLVVRQTTTFPRGTMLNRK